MDLNSAITGAIAILICFLPFVMITRSRKKKEKLFLKSLSDFAIQNNCQIDQREVFNSFAIGMDEAQNFVLFYSKTKDREIAQFVDLGKIQSCKVSNTNRTYKNKEGDHKVIDKLELNFIPTARNQPAVTMEFFNPEVSLQLSGELQSIEKWSKLINDRLKQQQH